MHMAPRTAYTRRVMISGNSFTENAGASSFQVSRSKRTLERRGMRVFIISMEFDLLSFVDIISKFSPLYLNDIEVVY